jgi:hypothetical protein
LDDSVLMATKWTMSGADAVLKLYPGRLAVFSTDHDIKVSCQLIFGDV